MSTSRLDEIREQIGHVDGASKLLSRREVKQLPDILWEDETIGKMVQGWYENGSGILVATNRRVVFVDKGITRLRVEDFAYDKISSIQYTTGLAFGKITIFASSNRAEIGQVAKNQTRVFAEYVRAQIAASSTPNEAPGTTVDIAGQLERLAKLRDQGALTDEEFEAQKQKLLNGSG